jgi:hypothetical protein
VFEDCRTILNDFASAVGQGRLASDLRPENFQRYRIRLAKRLGVHALTQHIIAIRSVFKYAYRCAVIKVTAVYAFEEKCAMSCPNFMPLGNNNREFICAVRPQFFMVTRHPHRHCEPSRKDGAGNLIRKFEIAPVGTSSPFQGSQ